MCSGVGLDGWFRWFAHPFGGGVCGGACAVPCFCFQLLRRGSGGFGIFVSSYP